jgi:hypothetical protein
MEYLLLIFEFFYVKNIKNFFSILIIPCVLSLNMFYVITDNFITENFDTLETNLITLLGILLGFTISFFAILITSNSLSIKKAQNEYINKTLFNRKISLFDIMITGIAYTIILECILLLCNLTIPVILISTNSHRIFFIINIGIISHLIIVLLRSVLDFYFSFTKK